MCRSLAESTSLRRCNGRERSSLRSASRFDSASLMSALLPGYRIFGLRGWDDFVVQDAANRSYSIPTVPLDLQCLSPFSIPPNVMLRKDERFEGKIKWYINPIVFGGDPKAEDNITWVSHEQHAQLVRWWNNLYRSVQKPPKPM